MQALLAPPDRKLMMQRITQVFVNRPPLVFVMIALIALAGSFALATLVQQQFPNINFPVVSVSVAYPGASPSELRDSVVIPVEDAIAGAPKLDHLNTSIQQNQATITAVFTLDSNQTTDLTEVQNRVQTVQSALPADLPAPSVRTFDPSQLTVATLSLTSRSLSIAALSALVTNSIVPTLEQVQGVSNVNAGGTVTPALEVTVDPRKLEAHGFVPTDVVSAIQANNVRAPGGIVYQPNRETTIDVRGDTQTAPSIADLLLSSNTSVLQGATSPSGTVTQHYTGLSGATNQALSLSSAATLASTSAAASASSGGGGGAAPSGSGLSLGAASSGPSSSSSGTSSLGQSAFSNANPITTPLPAPSAVLTPLVSLGSTSSSRSSTSSSTSSRSSGAQSTSSTLTTNSTLTTSSTLNTGTGQTTGSLTPTASVAQPATAATSSAGTSTTASASSTPAAGTAGTTTQQNGTSTLAAAGAATPSSNNAASTASTSTTPANLPIASIAQQGSGAASSGLASEATNPYSTMPQLLRIGDVATVSDWYEPKRVYSYVNGLPAITLGVQKANDASEVAASENVLAALPNIEAQYPDVQFNVLNVQAEYTKAQLWSVLETLVEAILFTGIAMFFFLRSWRNALVVMVAIPTSLFVTLFVMKVVGFTIDTVSLLAMTLIIGILVDDSIVVLENIERHYESGEGPRTAAILGRAEIGPAAIVITLVDVVVFLPIAFLPGQTGRFLAEFGLVVTIATLTSLAVSFTITPALAGNWSLLSRWKVPRFINAFTNGFERLRRFYSERILSGALKHSVLVAVACFALTVGACALIPLGYIGAEFIPAVDRGQIFVQVQYPTGTPLAITDAAVRKLTNAFLQISDVKTITSTSGSYQAGFGGGINLGSSGQLTVFLQDKRKHSTSAVAAMMNKSAAQYAPGARVFAVPATGTGGGNSQPIDATITATRGDPEQYAPQILQALQDTPGTLSANSSALQLSPQLDIEFNRDRARTLDVDIGLAAQSVRAAFGGTLATQFDTANGTKYVQVLYPMSSQSSIANLRNVPVRTRSGNIVHLSDIATLVNNPAGALITRINRATVVHISANLQPGYALSSVQRAFLARVKALNLPNTISVGAAAGGSQQNQVQTVQGLGLSLILSFLLVYLLMVALYDAYIAPFVILFSIPLAAIGVLGLLAITGQTFNLFSGIGIVMLVGLVSKNGILLVDLAHLKVSEGMEKLAAIKQAARERFRPIIMTTLSMIAGMTPLALALDPGSAAKRSLGTVVIGGLSSSLVLTLILIPVIFMWLAPGPHKAEPAQPLTGDGVSPAGALAVEPR